MPFVVCKVPMEHVQDTAGIEAAMRQWNFGADDIVAVVAKTEGNGGVNDISRILVDRVLRDFLITKGSRTRAQALQVPIALSGGCDGVISPHFNVFARVPEDDVARASKDELRLTVGFAVSEKILPEEIGRLPMVEKVAAGVRKAMKEAGITDPKDVHFVQTKTPLLTAERIADAKRRGKDVFKTEMMESMAVSNATAALGIGVGVGEFDLPREEQIARDLGLYSSVASCSSGVEQDEAQVVLVGNRKGIGGRFRIGHSVMKDVLDVDGIYDAIRKAGLPLPERPRPSDLGGALVNCFIKCETDPSGRLRGRRQVSLNDSDIHHTHHTKAVVGAVAAAAIGDPMVYCSVAALQQGPAGGGPVAAIIDASKVKALK
jgi:ring-opening amidohydrolase-like protein